MGLLKPKPFLFDGVGSFAKHTERNEKYAAGSDEYDLLEQMANGECNGDKIGKKHVEAAQWATEVLSCVRQLMLDVGMYGVASRDGQAITIVNLNTIQRSYDKTKGEKRYVPEPPHMKCNADKE